MTEEDRELLLDFAERCLEGRTVEAAVSQFLSTMWEDASLSDVLGEFVNECVAEKVRPLLKSLARTVVVSEPRKKYGATGWRGSSYDAPTEPRPLNDAHSRAGVPLSQPASISNCPMALRWATRIGLT